VSTGREIADALAESLNLYTFTELVPAVYRQNWPTFEIEDMADPVIAVMPAGFETTMSGRGPSGGSITWQYDYEMAVFVGRHTPTDELADGMVDLAEEVVDAIRQHSWDSAVAWPTSVTSPMLATIEINPDDALQDRNVWRAVITATYRVFR